MSGWLLDTLLLKHLAAGASTPRPSLRDWVSRNPEPIFLSMVSVVEIKARIEKVRATRQEARAAKLDDRLKHVVAQYSDRIYLVDADLAKRAGVLMYERSRVLGGAGPSLSNSLLAATAEIRGHTLLTQRMRDFTPWAKVELWDPFEQGLRDQHDGGRNGPS